MKIRKLKKAQSPITKRVENTEECLDTMLENLDTWIDQNDERQKNLEASLAKIREDLEAVIVKLNKIAKGEVTNA